MVGIVEITSGDVPQGHELATPCSKRTRSRGSPFAGPAAPKTQCRWLRKFTMESRGQRLQVLRQAMLGWLEASFLLRPVAHGRPASGTLSFFHVPALANRGLRTGLGDTGQDPTWIMLFFSGVQYWNRPHRLKREVLGTRRDSCSFSFRAQWPCKPSGDWLWRQRLGL